MNNVSFSVDRRRLSPGFSSGRFARAIAGEEARKQTEHTRLNQELDAWQQKHRAARTALLGTDNSARLREYAAQHRQPEPRPPFAALDPRRKAEERSHRVAESERFLDRLRIDRGALKRQSAAARADFEKIARRPPRLAGRATSTIYDLGFGGQPGHGGPSFLLPPTATPNQEALPPFSAWWERAATSLASGDGQVKSNDSYLNPDIGGTGSCIWSQNWDASDYDYLYSYRQNGFLVPYHVPEFGTIKVQFEIQCSLSAHCIETNNEYGWSDYSAWTNECAIIGMFWKWEDETPASEIADPLFVWGLDGGGNGDSSPHVVPMVPAGQIRQLTYFTDVAPNAGADVWIYVGVQQAFLGYINDVGLNTFVNSSWFITDIRISQA